jgi:large conductance mechanosensitive channel
MGIAKEFRDFILRGNVVDLAVGVIIGGAFGGIVTALVKDIITPFIGMFGKVDLSNLNTTIHGAKFGFGDFLNVVVSFLIIAFVVFFFIVKPVNHLMSLRKTETPVAPTTRECPYCLSSIPAAASRCAFCTAEVPAA